MSASYTPPEIPVYVEHAGTIRISGKTDPRRASKCAMHNLNNAVSPIEFLCIGANANQQATKAIGTFMYNVQRQFPKFLVAFQPLRYMVKTQDVVTNAEKLKDATVWFTVMVDRP